MNDHVSYVAYNITPPDGLQNQGVINVEAYAAAALSHFHRTDRPITDQPALRFRLNEIERDGSLRLYPVL
ncbi:hypothetical protein GJ699_02450 [Duganella sp. FT80W]|uniref:Uncharacterized protein n=1 Tax=Duganella guangzhouensis TaxID=2666084 RepID=A0A6I2KXU8_9BURK|nr:hypothetical protein [Duganella guangzhouensis]MRW88839.1 hypothetical protein [Duganella guangzhouensis]